MNKTTYDRGLEKGLEKGMEKGLEKGADERRRMYQAFVETAEALLQSRFGPLPKKIISQLNQLSPEQLKDLTLKATSATSLADLDLHSEP